MMKIVDELPDPFRQPSSDWERFDVHARRVRSIYMEPFEVEISPTIYLGIRAVRDSPPLPDLKQIYIPDNFPFHLSPDLSSALFLASVSTFNLVRLDGNAISEPPFFIPFLSSLHAKSPKLTHLVLRGVVNMSSLEHVHRFTNLQSLEIEVSGPYWHPPLLQQLGQLRGLLELTIGTGTSKETPASMQPHAKYPSPSYSNFGKLRKLHIRGNTISISRILNEMRNLSNLITLMIEGMCDDKADDTDDTEDDTDEPVDDTDDTVDDTDNTWTRSFEVISTYSAVEHIEINLHRRGGYSKYPLFVSWLSPLFKLDNLKNLIINGAASPLSGSDDDFRLLARAFLKLKKFIVPPITTNNLIGRTLACLYHFSRECADLREIKICVSFDIFENLNAIKMLPHPLVRNHRHPLEKLYINSDFGRLVQPSHLVRIARFLDLIFPNLSTLETDDSNTTEAETWAGIHEFRLALQDARIDASRARYL